MQAERAGGHTRPSGVSNEVRADPNNVVTKQTQYGMVGIGFEGTMARNQGKRNRQKLPASIEQGSASQTSTRFENATPDGKASRVLGFITDHTVLSIFGLVLAIIGIVVGVVSILVPHEAQHFDLTVDARIEAKLNPIVGQLNAADQKLTKLQSTLDTLQPFIQELVKRRMDEAASLPQREFNKRLPSISNTVSAATSSQTILDTTSVQAVNRKLYMALQDEAPVNGWDTAARLVTYRSKSASGFSQVSLPNCFTTFDKYTPHPVLGASHFADMLFGRCRLQIDDTEGFWKSPFGKIFLSEMAKDKEAKLRLLLTDVQIVSKGGAMIPFDELFAKNCTFDIQPVASPQPPQKRFLKDLLKTDFAKERISISLGEPETAPIATP